MRINYFITAFLLFSITALSAHPHMLLLSRLDFEFNERECTGVWVEWGFDDFFSASVIHDYDLNSNGFFENAEVHEIYNRAFINLKEYGYFVFLRKGDTRIQPLKVDNFTAWQKEQQLFYKFFIPLEESEYSGDFSVSIFDPTFFCAIRYQDPPATISQSSGSPPRYELVENKKYPVYYNPFSPASDNQTYDTWRKGLETAYPQEVQISFP